MVDTFQQLLIFYFVKIQYPFNFDLYLKNQQTFFFQFLPNLAKDWMTEAELSEQAAPTKFAQLEISASFLYNGNMFVLIIVAQ